MKKDVLKYASMVPGVPSVMTHSTSLMQVWSVDNSDFQDSVCD